MRTYLIGGLFILGWWGAVLFSAKEAPPQAPSLPPAQPIHAPSPIHRDELKQALLGNKKLMHTLLLHWDADAYLLEKQGVQGVKRLSANELAEASIAARSEEKPFPISILPQTYTAASILLALIPTNHLIALPKGFRDQGQLYPHQLTALIPTDFDAHHLDYLDNNPPDLVFIAPYSHLPTVQVLEKRGLPHVNLGNAWTEEDIQEAIQLTAHHVGVPQKGHLLNLFCKGALYRLDNALASIDQKLRILYLNHGSFFSVPTKKSLHGKLIDRLHFHAWWKQDDVSEEAWQIPIEIEEIIDLNPDLIFLSTTHPHEMYLYFSHHPALSELAAFKQGRVFFIDQQVQETPSQFYVLAYNDLVEPLLIENP